MQPTDLRPVLHFEHSLTIKEGSDFIRNQRVSLAAEATLDTPLEKGTGVAFGLAAGAVVWRAAQDRANRLLTTAMIVHLVLAGCTTLALLVVVESAGDPSQPPPAGPVTTPRSTGTAPVNPPVPQRAIMLVDLTPSADGNGWESGSRMIAGRSYAKSYVARVDSSRSCAESDPTIEFDLGGRYRTFQATVGVSDSAKPTTRAEFVIGLDGIDQHPTHSVVSGQRQDVEVAVSGKARLRLTVRNGSECGSYYVWGDARLLP